MAKVKKEVDLGTEIHSTNVRIDMLGLSKTLKELEANYNEVGNRDSKEGRSLFSQWNNINHFYNRILSGEIPSTELTEETAVIKVTGSVKGNTTRVYYKPSITSLSKHIRKHIIPLNEGSSFVFFDLKAAEFFMNCIFCGEHEAVAAYQRGEDIYKFYSSIFPKATPRAVYKEALIGNMYGLTGYTLSARMRANGIDLTQNQADNLLSLVARNLKAMTANKQKVISLALRTRTYQCPNMFDQTDLLAISRPKEGESINNFLALSTYVQSALGIWIQNFIKKLSPRINGTLLTVFDSVLCEVKNENIEKYKEWASTKIAPFRVDQFSVGKTFYDAQENN